MKALRFVFLTIFSLFAILYLIYVSYVYFNQAEMVFMASKLPKDFQFQFNEDFEEINISSFDNQKQNGLLFKTKNPKGLIFYLHGNAGAIDSWGRISKIYTDLGYDIFILDYRGFGKSEGKIDDEFQVNTDISYAYQNLKSKYSKSKIIIIGYSIGTGPATYLASNENPEKLILQAPYYNFIEFSNGRVPYIPDFLKKFQFETNKYITKVKCHVIIFHGNQDRIISYENSVRLQKLFKPKDALFVLENQDHMGINDNMDFQEKLKVILE